MQWAAVPPQVINMIAVFTSIASRTATVFSSAADMLKVAWDGCLRGQIGCWRR